MLLIILRKAYGFFELNCGWFFVNGRKREAWNRYIAKKYKSKNF